MPAAITKPKPINEIKAELEEIRAKKKAGKPVPEKRDWYGLVYCDSNGYASITGDNLESIWLGKTDEIIPCLKKERVDGQNVDSVLLAVENFRAEKKEAKLLHKDFGRPTVSKTHSGHLATKNEKTPITIPPEKSVVATFRHDPKFLRLLETLIARDIGVRTIHSELQKKGYSIPQRTVTRWVSRMRSSQLL